MVDDFTETVPAEIVEAFLLDAMEIQEHPRFMDGANDSARKEKLRVLVEEYGEKF